MHTGRQRTREGSAHGKAKRNGRAKFHLSRKPFSNQQSAFSLQPSAFSLQQSAFSLQPSPPRFNRESSTAQPSYRRFAAHGELRDAGSAGSRPQLHPAAAPAAEHQAAVSRQPSAFSTQPSFLILHPSAFILHPSSFILHPSSFSLQPSSFIPRSSFLAPPPPWFQTQSPSVAPRFAARMEPRPPSPRPTTKRIFISCVSCISWFQKTPPSICVDLCSSVVPKTNPPAQRLRWNLALPVLALPQNASSFRVFRVFRGSKNTPIHLC
jgi:hypothetical protein